MASVLIVDDDHLIAEAWCDALEGHDYEVFVALSGEEAAALLKSRAFDVVVTDLNMPDGGGMYVSGMTRMLQGHKKIIVVSGYLSPSLAGVARRNALANLGVRCFLSKPISIEELISAVEEVMELE